MPHLHTGDGHHDFTISAFIIRTDLPEPAVILHEHLKLSKLLQFGGHVELDETPFQALIREIREESGYDASQLQFLQPPGAYKELYAGTANHPLPFSFNTHPFSPLQSHFHSDLAYAVLANSDPLHQIAERESAAVHLFTTEQIKAIPSAEIYDQTRASALYIIERLMPDWEPVPASAWPL